MNTQNITTTNPMSYDFNDIMDSAIRFMRTQDEWKDFDFTGSGIRELMRVLAYFSQQQAFQNNFMFSEANILSAQIPNNVYSFASSVLGYLPKGKRAARIIVPYINVHPDDDQHVLRKIIMDKDVRFYASKDGVTYQFSPSEVYEAELNADGYYRFENVELLQGIWHLSTYVVQSAYSVERFEIDEDNIDIDTLNTVMVKPSPTTDEYEVYRKFEDAYDLGSESKTFFVKKNRRGKYELEFGDDRLSKRLEYGNIVVAEYLVTEGAGGNRIYRISPSSSIGGYYNIEVGEAEGGSFGGDEPESIETTKIYAPLVFESQGAAVNSSSYEAIVKATFPNISDVVSWGGEDNDPVKYGYAFISAKPEDREFLSEDEKRRLIEILDERNVGSITPVYTDPTYIYINSDVEVRYNPNKTVLEPITLKIKIEDYIKKFSINQLERFRAKLDYSELNQYINSIDDSIQGNLLDVTLQRLIVPEVERSYAYSVNFSTELEPGTIRADGFRIVDENQFENAYTIEDDGRGVLYIWRTAPSGLRTRVRRSGTVDYVTGIVQISDFTPSYVFNIEGNIPIYAKPSVLGFYEAKRNNILILNNINVDLKVVVNV